MENTGLPSIARLIEIEYQAFLGELFAMRESEEAPFRFRQFRCIESPRRLEKGFQFQRKSIASFFLRVPERTGDIEWVRFGGRTLVINARCLFVSAKIARCK